MATNVIINTFKDSSVLDACVYNATQKLLLIMFKSGSVWAYEGVSQQEFRLLLRSKSAGKYFNQAIRNNHPATMIYKPGENNGQEEEKQEETATVAS